MDEGQQIMLQNFGRNYLTWKELEELIEDLRVKVQKEEAEKYNNNPQNNQ